MAYDRNTTLGTEGENSLDPTDTRKIIEEHLHNKDHEITDEHIRNVKVGKDDEPAPLGAEIEARFNEDMTDEKENDKEPGSDIPGIPETTGTPDTAPGTKPPNAWNVLE